MDDIQDSIALGRTRKKIHVSPVSSLLTWLWLMLLWQLRRRYHLCIRNLKSVHSARCERIPW